MFYSILSVLKAFAAAILWLSACLISHPSVCLFPFPQEKASVCVALKCLSSYPHLLLNIHLPADLGPPPFLPSIFVSPEALSAKSSQLPLTPDSSCFCHCEFCFFSITLHPSFRSLPFPSPPLPPPTLCICECEGEKQAPMYAAFQPVWSQSMEAYQDVLCSVAVHSKIQRQITELGLSGLDSTAGGRGTA